MGPTTLATFTVLAARVRSRGAQQWGGSIRFGIGSLLLPFCPLCSQKGWPLPLLRGEKSRGFEEIPLRPVGSAPGVCTAGPFAGLFHHLERGKLARLVHGKTLSAEQHCSHVVEAVRLVQVELAEVRYWSVRTRLCFQPAKDLGRVYLLYKQRAGRALEGVVVWVGLGPGKAVAVQVFGGQECLEPLPFC